MKRLFTLLLVMAMIVSLPITVFAQEQEDGKVFVNEEYGYMYTKQIDEFNRVICTYENPNAYDMSIKLQAFKRYDILDTGVTDEQKYAKIKSVLRDLGKTDSDLVK